VPLVNPVAVSERTDEVVPNATHPEVPVVEYSAT
jgi:hypothetical protein